MQNSKHTNEDRIILTNAQTQTLQISHEIIMRYRAVMLYETTGAGKTYIACALAQKIQQIQNIEIYIIAPAHLLHIWENVLKTFKLKAKCYSYQAASLGKIPTSNSLHDALWIIDEAHMLKNPSSKRYQNLKYLTAQHRICLLSATPVSLGWKDLHTLMLLCGYPHPFDANQTKWLQAFALALTPKTYVPALGIDAHVHCQHINLNYTISPNAPLVTALLDTLQKINWYTIDPQTRLLHIPLLSHMLMHRLCSHRTSCLKTLQKMARYYQTCQSSTSPKLLTRQEFYRWMGMEGKQKLLPFESNPEPHISHTNIQNTLQSTYHYMIHAIQQLQILCDTEDHKYIQLENYLQNIPNDQKVVIFSQYVDTANYFAQKLQHKFRVALLTADQSMLNGIPIQPDIVAAMFDPTQTLPDWWQSHGFRAAQILVCSDAFACGHNFHQASVIIHLDTPWNPTLVKQRNGRILRKGQKAQNITLVNMQLEHAPLSLFQYETMQHQRLTKRQKLQNEWSQISTLPSLETETYLVCHHPSLPTFWAKCDMTWIPVAPQTLPNYINAFLSAECSTISTVHVSPNINRTITHHTMSINDDTEVFMIDRIYTNLRTAFYPMMHKLRKTFEIYWKIIKKYQYLPDIRNVIQSIYEYTFQCTLYPQLLSNFQNTVPLSKPTQEIYKNIIKLPLNSIPPMSTPCTLLHIHRTI